MGETKIYNLKRATSAHGMQALRFAVLGIFLISTNLFAQQIPRCERNPFKKTSAEKVEFSCGSHLLLSSCKNACPQQVRAERLRLQQEVNARETERTVRHMPTSCGIVDVNRINYLAGEKAHQLNAAFEVVQQENGGHLFCSMNKVEHAEELACEQLLRSHLSCDAPNKILLDAQKALQKQNFKEAQLLLTPFLATKPSFDANLQGYLLLGIAWYHLGERGRASAAFLRALHLLPTVGLTRVREETSLRTQQFFRSVQKRFLKAQTLLAAQAMQKTNFNEPTSISAKRKNTKKSNALLLPAPIPAHCKASYQAAGVIAHCKNAEISWQEYNDVMSATAQLQQELAAFQKTYKASTLDFMECTVSRKKSRCAQLKNPARSQWMSAGAVGLSSEKAVVVRCVYRNKSGKIPKVCRRFISF